MAQAMRDARRAVPLSAELDRNAVGTILSKLVFLNQ
jgi:hypothetical protein